MAVTRIFFPQHALDLWLAAGSARMTRGLFTTLPEQHQYRVFEAVRVLNEVTGAEDKFQLSGKVKPIGYVAELGAELLGDSMILGDNAYDVVLGWVAVPEQSPRQEMLDNLGVRQQAEAESLAQFLARNL